MNRENLKRKLKENRWLIAAVIFFILWKFFLIHILWQGRFIPPEPDDSYEYISHIAAVADCRGFHLCSFYGISMKSSTGFVYLSYRLFFGIIAKITRLSPLDVYHSSFYFGTILLAFVLYPFLKIFTRNKNLIAWSIFFLSFCHGIGMTHGFFWVVPSFFSVFLFFILVAYILSIKVKFRIWLAILLSLLYVFSHPISVFLLLILSIYLLIYFLFTREPNRLIWGRTILITSLAFLFSFSLSHYLSGVNPENYVYGAKGTLNYAGSLAQTAIKNIVPKKENEKIEAPSTQNHENSLPVKVQEPVQQTNNFYPTYFNQKIKILWDAYFHWFFPHWSFLFIFAFCFFILIYKKEFEIISFYLASFAFFFLAVFLNPMGFRSAVILWPITYIFLAFSSWNFIKLIRENFTGYIKIIILGAIFLFLLLFFSINAFFALAANENINIRNDYSIPPNLVNFLLNEISPNKTLVLPTQLMVPELVNTSLGNNLTSADKMPDYIITADSTKYLYRERSLVFKIAKGTVGKLGFSMRLDNLNSPSFPSSELKGYAWRKKFGIFDVYEATP